MLSETELINVPVPAKCVSLPNNRKGHLSMGQWESNDEIERREPLSIAYSGRRAGPAPRHTSAPILTLVR
jgi:hypothetical protein